MIRKMGSELPQTKNDYHRPQDKWVDQPLSSDGAEGNGSQRRVRSLRSQRTMFTLAVTSFTIGALIILGTSPYKNDFLAPGPLCSSHAQILEGQGADRCAACHGASDQTLASWLTDTLTGGRTIPVSQSDLCMKCHEKSISPDFALNPHSIAIDELKQRTEKIKQTSSVSSIPIVQSLSAPFVGSHAEIACSACHREHHGLSDLTAVTDQQCQSCHARTFDSFEGNHPEFTNWPLQRRSKIAFDHSTHAGKHFPGKSKEFNCNQCHVDGPHGNVKLLASFEQSCAECHDQQIQQSGEDGFAIFALPSIDPQAIEDQDLQMGSWPLAATGDFDGRIPPVMSLLLHADPVAQEVLERLRNKFGDEFDFADIDPAVAADVVDATELMWAIKRLLYDLAEGGHAALRERLSRASGVDVSLSRVMSLANELDRSVFKNTVRRWLPDLETELVARDARRVGSFERPASEADTVSPTLGRFLLAKFTKLDPSDDQELAANPLKGLLAGAGGAEAEIADTDRPAGQKNDLAATNADDQRDQFGGVGSTKPKKRKTVTLRNSLGDAESSDSDLLAINPLSTDAVFGNGEISRSRSGLAVDSPGKSEVREAVDRSGVAQRSSIKSWEPPPIARAGWYRDDEVFQVFYRPGGHEDQCIQAWSDLVASVVKANERPEWKPLFDQLLSDKGVGLCASCHTVDQVAGHSFDVNWSPEYRDPTVGAFTKFSHQPHTLQPHLRDCSACHDMSKPVSNKDSFVSHDPSEVVSNFAPITKLNCVNCHRKGGTNNGCTHCHSYHVEKSVDLIRN